MRIPGTGACTTRRSRARRERVRDGFAPHNAHAAQEDTPTTPEGEEEPGQDGPTGDGDVQSTGDDVVSPGEDVPSDGEESASPGSLPTTGLELAALASIGLGLVAAGAALRIRTTS